MQNCQDPLDLLDQGRKDDLFEDLEGFMEKWEQNNKMEIQSLEQNVENERQRLDAMEKSFVGAKTKSLANDIELRYVAVTKQSKILNGMMDVFKNMTSREIEAKKEWDSQWQEKFAEIRQQHIEMKRSLKRKHGIELKMLKESFRDGVRSLSLKFQASKGIPSPHAIRRVQDQNMRKVVVLYHRHAEERMLLLGKIMNQEELMIRAKNKSLQNKMNQTQVLSKKLYVKLKKSSPNQDDVNENESAEAGRRSSHEASNIEPPTLTPIQVYDVGFKRGVSRSSTTVFPVLETSVLSPKYPTSTFVTELSEDAHRWEAKKSKPVNTSFFQHERVDFEQNNRRPSAYTRMGDTGCVQAHVKGDSTRNSSNEDQANGFPHAVDSLGPMQHQGLGGASFPGQEFVPWSQPSPQTVLTQGKPVWNSHPCRWNPNIIALENSFISPATAAEPSPYAMFSVDGRSAGTAALRKRYARPSRVLGGARTAHGRSSSTGPSPGPLKSAAALSLSSLPSLRKERAYASRSTANLPEIGRNDPNRHRQKFNDQNFNRPKQHGGIGDKFPKAAEKYEKLDSWIEEKILQVLGGNSSKSSILAHQREDFVAELDQSIDEEHDHWQDRASPAGYCAPTPGRHRDRDGGGNGGGGGDSTGNATPADRWHPFESLSSQSGHRTNLTNEGSVGGFLARLPSGMVDSDAPEEGSPANPGLSVQVHTGNRSTASLTSAQINDLLNPIKGKQTKEVPQDEEGSIEFIGSNDEQEDIAERRARFDRVSGTVLVPQSHQGSVAPKTPKRVGWNLSPRESEAGNVSEMGTDTLRLSTAGGYDSSRPVTHSSSRPDTSHSMASFIGEGDEDEEGNEGQRESQPTSSFTDSVVTEFFSKVRHNKVAECEELVNIGFPMDARDRHGNTPLLVAAQNGHKRLVKMFLRVGANPNSTNHQGNTALHFTLSYGYQGLANYILSKGADDTLINMKGLTCYDGLG
jgi:hypothetical protein